MHSSLDCIVAGINSSGMFAFKQFRYELLKLELVGRSGVETPSGTNLNLPRQQYKTSGTLTPLTAS